LGLRRRLGRRFRRGLRGRLWLRARILLVTLVSVRCIIFTLSAICLTSAVLITDTALVIVASDGRVLCHPAHELASWLGPVLVEVHVHITGTVCREPVRLVAAVKV